MKIGNFDLNKDGTLIITELSSNYNANLQNASDTIKAAKEFAEMIEVVRDTEKLLGKVDYSMTEELKQSRRFSRNLYVSKDIKKGDVFTNENIRSVRPGYGLHPKYFKNILGQKASKNMKFGEALDILYSESSSCEG